MSYRHALLRRFALTICSFETIRTPSRTFENDSHSDLHFWARFALTICSFERFALRHALLKTICTTSRTFENDSHSDFLNFSKVRNDTNRTSHRRAHPPLFAFFFSHPTFVHQDQQTMIIFVCCRWISKPTQHRCCSFLAFVMMLPLASKTWSSKTNNKGCLGSAYDWKHDDEVDLDHEVAPSKHQPGK